MVLFTMAQTKEKKTGWRRGGDNLEKCTFIPNFDHHEGRRSLD